MTITPGIPEDWADTNPESTTPERILPTPEGVTPSATKVAMVCYAVGAASKCWEHPERAGVFDSDRASQIVTELCVALGVEQQGDAAPESARPATLTPEQAENAPAQGEDSQRPSEPVLPRQIEPGDYEVERVAATIHDAVKAAQAINVEAVYRSTGLNLSGGSHDFANIAWDAARAVVRDFDVRLIKEPAAVDEASPEAPPAFEPSEPVLPRPIDPEDVRVGMVVERRKGEAAHRDRVQQIDGELIVGTDGAWLWVPGNADGGWSLWLIGDAPEPVDPDAELVERMAKEVHDRNCADVGCRDWDGHGESTRKAWREDARVVIRNLRAQGFDVTARAEQ